MAERTLADLGRWSMLPQSQNIEDRRRPSDPLDLLRGEPSLARLFAGQQGANHLIPIGSTPYDADIDRLARGGSPPSFAMNEPRQRFSEEMQFRGVDSLASLGGIGQFLLRGR